MVNDNKRIYHLEYFLAMDDNNPFRYFKIFEIERDPFRKGLNDIYPDYIGRVFVFNFFENELYQEYKDRFIETESIDEIKEVLENYSNNIIFEHMQEYGTDDFSLNNSQISIKEIITTFLLEKRGSTIEIIKNIEENSQSIELKNLLSGVLDS